MSRAFALLCAGLFHWIGAIWPPRKTSFATWEPAANCNSLSLYYIKYFITFLFSTYNILFCGVFVCAFARKTNWPHHNFGTSEPLLWMYICVICVNKSTSRRTMIIIIGLDCSTYNKNATVWQIIALYEHSIALIFLFSSASMRFSLSFNWWIFIDRLEAV